MKNRLFFTFLTFTYLLFLISCGPPVDEGFISQGIINFDAEVLNTDSPMASMAPSTMVYKFKDNKSSVEMSAGMGLLKTSFISDPEKITFTQLVKLMDNKYSNVLDNDGIKKENELFNLEITPTNETKMIAGYKCKKANVHYKGGDPADYDVYYTNGLNIKNANFASPYFTLDGVLMEFKIKKFGLEIKFTATSVQKEEIENTTFDTPNEYKKISPEEMVDLFSVYL